MTSDDRVFAGSIPELYDRYLGPLIFEPYAEEVADRIASLRPARILETASGTGVLTRALVRRCPPPVEIIATDLNQPMLDFAESRGGLSGVTLRQANAMSLPFPDAAFDVVACQFGAMFLPDKVTAYAEARRVLRRGGHLILAVWDRIADNEFTDVVTQAVGTLFPTDPPLFLARTPHGYADRAAIEADLAAAGFAETVIETIERRSQAASHHDPAIGFCHGTPLRNEIEARGPGRLDEATETAAAALAKRFGEGTIDGKIQAHIVTART